MPSERCGNCRFLEPVATVCRRYPPTIAVIDGKEVSFRLVVFADIGWCGEWQAQRTLPYADYDMGEIRKRRDSSGSEKAQT